jgi:hypothetical protein
MIMIDFITRRMAMRKRGEAGGIGDGRWKKSPSAVPPALPPSPSQTSVAINGRHT